MCVCGVDGTPHRVVCKNRMMFILSQAQDLAISKPKAGYASISTLCVFANFTDPHQSVSEIFRITGAVLVHSVCEHTLALHHPLACPHFIHHAGVHLSVMHFRHGGVSEGKRKRWREADMQRGSEGARERWNVRESVCIYKYTIYIYIYIYMHIYINILYMYVYKFAYTYIYLYIHICIHIYIYIYTHTYTY